MESITNALEQLASLIEAAEAITEALSSLREELSEDQWEALENSPLDSLVCACMDLEYTIESMS